jgi:hypothetical protein
LTHAPTPSGQKRSTFDAATLVDADGIVDVAAVIAAFLIDRRTLASIAGLPRGALAETARPRSPVAEARLREIVDILVRVTPWAGSPPQALAWYRAQPLAGFGGTTAQKLVRQGHADAVKAHLETVADGGYA